MGPRPPGLLAVRLGIGGGASHDARARRAADLLRRRRLARPNVAGWTAGTASTLDAAHGGEEYRVSPVTRPE